MSVFALTFALNFFLEWGDRSQVVTAAMVVTQDYWDVVTGTIIGVTLCIMLAIYVGKVLATKVSLNTMHLISGLVMIFFAIKPILSLFGFIR